MDEIVKFYGVAAITRKIFYERYTIRVSTHIRTHRLYGSTFYVTVATNENPATLKGNLKI